MNGELRQALERCETDIDGTLERFSGDEGLYFACMKDFLADTTMQELCSAMQGKKWDEVFTAAHALKGVAGNMGFVPLFYAAGELVVKVRAGRLDQLEEACKQVRTHYDSICGAVRLCLGAPASL